MAQHVNRRQRTTRNTRYGRTTLSSRDFSSRCPSVHLEYSPCLACGKTAKLEHATGTQLQTLYLGEQRQHYEYRLILGLFLLRGNVDNV